MSRVFDHSGSLRRMGCDEELFQDMVGFFHEDSPRLLARIDEASRTSDWAQVALSAHTLKGLVSNFGAARASSAAELVEERARHDGASLAERELSELRAAIEELQTALSPYMGSAG